MYLIESSSFESKTITKPVQTEVSPVSRATSSAEAWRKQRTRAPGVTKNTTRTRRERRRRHNKRIGTITLRQRVGSMTRCSEWVDQRERGRLRSRSTRRAPKHTPRRPDNGVTQRDRVAGEPWHEKATRRKVGVQRDEADGRPVIRLRRRRRRRRRS